MKEFVAIILVVFVVISICYCGYDCGYNDAMRKVPTAMDVYKGKTTLQYTMVSRLIV